MKKIFILLSISFLLISSVHAGDPPFNAGEKLKYDVNFKWGLIMMKAGTANYTIEKGFYENNSSFKTILDFKTSSFFDGIFKIRDTLISHVNTNLEPLYHIRKINEGKTRFWEEVFTNTFSANFTKARIKRQNTEKVKFDTIIVTNNAGYDILSIFMFARTLDYSQLTPEQTFHISGFIGKDKVNIIAHYKGQSVVEKNESIKYKAHLLDIDITDEAFKESKNAMEIWVSDDKNHVPLKLRAKLRIGAAEASLTSWQNLKYPLTSEIKIPVR